MPKQQQKQVVTASSKTEFRQKKQPSTVNIGFKNEVFIYIFWIYGEVKH